MQHIIEIPKSKQETFKEARAQCGFYPDCLKLKEESKFDKPENICSLCWINTIRPEREEFAKNPNSDRIFYNERCYLLKTMDDV